MGKPASDRNTPRQPRAQDDSSPGDPVSPWATPPPPPSRPRKARWRWRLLSAAAITALAAEGLWFGIHEIPGFGPALVDGVRGVVGPAPIAWAEDVAYEIADRVNQLRYGSAPPKTFWTPPPPSPAGPTQPASVTSAPEAPAAPPPFSPPFERVAAPGDGAWLPMPDAVNPGGAPVLWKSAVHPDPRRGFAAVAVVAIDLSRVSLHLVAGTQEPESTTVPREERPGLIPADRASEVIAAFNGGFKAMHGHYGMMLAGATYLAPRDIACTIGLYRDGTVRIGKWTSLRDSEPEMHAYRQTPPCLVQQGTLHAHLSESNRNWGATVSGETIIRRSALGIDKTGRFLFYGLGEAVSAQAIARAMQAAGAHDAAQLDVNHAYPRFLLFAPGSPPQAASSLIPDVQFKPTEYTADPSPRDFFYLARSPRPQR